jgi:dolichol-phosphate mannosyltransferase
MSGTGTPIDLSIVIPVRDEAASLPALLSEIRAAFDGALRYEVVIVDDGSTDDSVAVIGLERTLMPSLRLIRHRQGYGQSSAIHSGVRAAAAEWVATLDGDGQNDPADLPRAWAHTKRLIADGVDVTMLVGHRVKRQDRATKRLSSRFANAIRRRLLDDATPDTGCSLKLFRRETFLALPFFDHMHRFLPALILRQGGKVVSMPVNHRPRQRGVSKYGLFDRLWIGIVDLLGVMWLRRRMQIVEILPDDGA